MEPREIYCEKRGWGPLCDELTALIAFIYTHVLMVMSNTETSRSMRGEGAAVASSLVIFCVMS